MNRDDNNINAFRSKGWMKLDNAAKLFPAITTGELTSVFRITAYLKKPVRYTALKEAVKITSERFPYFSVSLGSGLFWHYLEFNNQPPRILTEEKIPCAAFALKSKNEPLYRVLARENRISVEFLHVLTDGAGAFEYLKSLLFTYLKLEGDPLTSPSGIILPETPFSEDEIQDGYNKYFKKLPPPVKIDKAWHIPFGLNDKPRLKVIRARVKASEVLEVARSHNVSLTEYFVSVYLWSLQNIYESEAKEGKKQKDRVLRTEVPVNMRNKFPLKTMRNFSLFVMPEIDLRLGSYTFEEVLKTVHHHIQSGADLKQISRFLSSNVGHEKLFIIRILPLFIKRIVISSVYRGLGIKRSSGIMTNLGQIKLPEDMQEYFSSFELLPPPPNHRVKVSCAIVTLNDTLSICFSNISKSNELERNILKHLVNSGIHVRLINNH